MTEPLIPAWLVRWGERRAVFIEQSRARDYAAQVHGTIHPLCEMGGVLCSRPAEDVTRLVEALR